MAISVTITGISQDAAGRVTVAFNDQTSWTFCSKTDALRWVQNLDQLNDDATTLVKRLILAWWIARDPTGATPSTVVNKTVTFNLTGSPLISVS